MSDNIRTVQVGGQTIELCYESDLYWLWAWYDKIDVYLYGDDEEPPPPPGDWLGPFILFPSKKTTEAMARFSVNYRYVVEQLQRFSDATDEKLTAFVEHESDDTKEDLATAMDELRSEIESAVLLIAENEARNKSGDDIPAQPEDKPEKKPKATVNARMFEAVSKDPQKLGWTAKKWANHLDCAASTVVTTTTWKSLRMENMKRKAEKKDTKRELVRKGKEEGLL